MLSTPILTSIFGDGSLEVTRQSYKKKKKKNLFQDKKKKNIFLILNQGKDTEDWAHSEEPAEMEVKELCKHFNSANSEIFFYRRLVRR